MAIASGPSEPRGAADPATRAALRVLQVAAIAVVVAALPYPAFDLDRHGVPKELVVQLAGFGAGVLCLARVRRFELTVADALLVCFLAVSTASALLATNHWLAFRALGLSLAGALTFWSARAVARAGLAGPLVTTLAAGVIAGAITALLQAYGVELSVMAERRAPGGTFGNRNFMAHFMAFGLPVLGLAGLEARRRVELGWWQAGVALVSAALVLSRSRAAWLALGVALAVFAVEGLWAGGLWQNRVARGRVLALVAAGAVGATLALTLPNRLEWRSESPYLDSLRGIADYKEGSGRGRLVQYQNTLRMAMDHPALGVGPGNWAVAYPRYTFAGDPAFDPDDFIPTNPWPSSDWVALLAERGPLAPLAALLVGIAVGVGAWRRWRQGPRTSEGLESLTAFLTLIVLALVSAFDAVLLLPAPTFFAAAMLGALVRPPKRAGLEIAVPDARRPRIAGVVALTGLLFVLRSVSQIGAMAVFSSSEKLTTREWAARIDPSSYRIQMLLAYAWRYRGRCDQARPHAEAAHALFPNHPAPKQLLVACRGQRGK